MSKLLATKVSTPQVTMSKLGTKCQYFVWPPLFSSTALTLLGIEFIRASQVATGLLFHSSVTTSQSWWMLETLHTSTFHFRMPHRCSIGLETCLASPSPLPSASLMVVWRCVWGHPHVGILPCSPVSEGRGSYMTSSVCHSTCWHS